jgi:hypothetical protein
MGYLPRDESARRAILGIASVAFGIIMREVANRRRAAAQQPQPAPPADPEPAPQVAPKIVIRMERPLPPQPSQVEPAAGKASVMTRSVTWGGWTFYLLARVSLVTVATLLLDISATTQGRTYFYLALLPGIGALLIPYGKPRQHRIEGPGALTVCSALVAVAIWPWYFYASATAPLNPVTVISTESFTLSPRGISYGCAALLDNEQRTWYINGRALDSMKGGRIILYQTTFGWIPDRQATQSPSPFFGIPHLNQAAYSLTPQGSQSSAACMVYDGSGGH